MHASKFAQSIEPQGASTGQTFSKQIVSTIKRQKNGLQTFSKKVVDTINNPCYYKTIKNDGGADKGATKVFEKRLDSPPERV